MNRGIELGRGAWILVVGCALAACDDGEVSKPPHSDPVFDPIPAPGDQQFAGASSTGSFGSAAGAAADGIPIPLLGGRAVNADLGIQGAVFVDSDPYTAVGLTSNLTAPIDPTISNACIRGTAAKVDQTSTPCITQTFTPPAVDCFGEYWGAAIGINLNQPIDPNNLEPTTPLPLDVSALEGFAFNVDGTVPSGAAFRFQVEADTGAFCTPASVKLTPGDNRVLFSQLLERCFRISTDPPNATAVTVQSKVTRISWHVVTNDTAGVPFDFCISNLRALSN